jgi:hypothetical protein
MRTEVVWLTGTGCCPFPHPQVSLFAFSLVRRGVIPRAVNDVFQKLSELYDASSEVTVYCSFMQLYNEKLYDLLRDR